MANTALGSALDQAYMWLGNIAKSGIDENNKPCKVEVEFFFSPTSSNDSTYKISAMVANILKDEAGASATYMARTTIVDGPQCPEIKEQSETVFHIKNELKSGCHDYKANWQFRIDGAVYAVITNDGEKYICQIR